MKTVKSILKNLVRPALLAFAGAALLVSTASGATAEMWVKARGTTWAWLVPGSNTGGKLVWNAQYCRYITDRAARGEQMEVWFDTSTAAERYNPRISRVWRSSTVDSPPLSPRWNTLPSYVSFTVPVNPAADNNHIHITTASGTFSTRIPVGTR